MPKSHPDQFRRCKVGAKYVARSAPPQLAIGLISQSSAHSAAILKWVSPCSFFAGFRKAIASMMLFCTNFEAVGQNDLPSNPAVLKLGPAEPSATLSKLAAKREAYKDAITGVRSDLKSPAIMVELAIDLARDIDPEVQSMAVGALLSVEPYISDTERVNYARLCGKMFRPILDEIGIDPRPGESAAVPQVRTSLLGALGLVAADPEIIAHSRKIALELLGTTNLTWRPEMYTPLYITTVHGEAAWAKKVQEAYGNAPSGETRTRLLHALIGFRDPALVRGGLDYALTNVVESKDFVMVLLSGTLKETAAVRFEWLKENYEIVGDRLDQKTLQVYTIDMISAGDSKLFANGSDFLLDPKRRTPILEGIVEARTKELAPLFASR